MRARLETFPAPVAADTLAAQLRHRPGFAYLRTGQFDVASARYSLVAADPAVLFRSLGSHGEITRGGRREAVFGDPWRILGRLLGEFEQLDEVDVPFPLGAAIGYWGYDLRQFVEPRVGRRAVNDVAVPDCQVGFHGSLAVYDHQRGEITVVATGLGSDGRRTERRQEEQLRTWRQRLFSPATEPGPWAASSAPGRLAGVSLGREEFLEKVRQAQRYIRQGDIYQVNLAQRLQVDGVPPAWNLFERWCARSPAPFSLFIDAGDFALVSASPELFLRLSGAHALTRPIKGTRPRSPDPARDAQLTYELQRSEKEMAELVMITDLLRNDLGRISEFGSVRVPELVRLERFAHVQHLVSTVEGRLRPEVSHLDAMAACFPGGSITGAPKIRAMEIIDELEPVARGPYCGCHGYLGFNRESQLAITIRTAVVRGRRAWYHAGAGIVADSIPEAEHDETLAKARGFLEAAGVELPSAAVPSAPARMPDSGRPALAPSR